MSVSDKQVKELSLGYCGRDGLRSADKREKRRDRDE